jgi:hypothetical protein
MLEDAILRGTRGAQPAANTVGTGAIYYVTDESVLERSDGAAWESYSGIADDAITYAKMQNISAASRLLGRGSATGAGSPEELTLGTGLSMAGTVLSASSGTALVTTVDRALTAVEIRALNTTPIELVAAPGANKVIIPLAVYWWVTRTATAYSANPSFRIRWNGIAFDLFTAMSFFLSTASAGEKFQEQARLPIDFAYGSGSDPTNKSLQVSATADTTTGTGTIKVGLAYYLLEF